MTPRERADRAQEMLESPVFKAAFADIRDSIVGKIESSGIGDAEAHHYLAIALQSLRSVRTQFARYAEEIAIDKAAEKHETWLKKARQQLMP